MRRRIAFCLALAATACVSTGFAPVLVAIPVADVKASAAWYERNAGFVLRSEQPDRAILERAQFQLELVKADGCTPRRDFVRIAFHIPDIDPLIERLRANGVTFQTEPHDDLSEGTRSCIVLDNEGNWIQFTGPLPSPTVPGAAKMSL